VIQPIELERHSSNSMTRGIPNTTCELRADILILDVRLANELSMAMLPELFGPEWDIEG